MALDCGATLAKYLLCIFNFVFFIAGTVVLALGIWLAADKNSFINLSKISDHETLQQFSQPSVIEQGAYILIAVGAFVFVISFLGYCGAVKESRILLIAYGMFLIAIFILEVTAIALAAIYKAEAETETKGFLKFTLREYYSTPDKGNVVTIAWNYMMKDLHCCGVNNDTDFKIAKKWMKHKKDDVNIPVACCKLTEDVDTFTPTDPNCPKTPSDENSYHKTGCYKKFLDWAILHLNIVIGACVVLGVIQLLGIIFSFCLCVAIENNLK